jgi:hypothetical protein
VCGLLEGNEVLPSCKPFLKNVLRLNSGLTPFPAFPVASILDEKNQDFLKERPSGLRAMGKRMNSRDLQVFETSPGRW